MSHFAVIAPPFLSHVRTLEALLGELLRRGHRVTWLARPEVRALIRDSRIGFAPVGAVTDWSRPLSEVAARAARPGSPWGLRHVIEDMAEATTRLCAAGRQALRQAGADVVIADQMEAAGGLLAEALRLPCVSVACALPVNREPLVPLPVMPWAYEDSERALQRNLASARIHDWFMAPHARAVQAAALGLGLPPRQGLWECLSPQLQISQTTPGFDFPRTQLPAHFHAVGPLRAPPAAEPPLALPVRDGKAFVFASLGTMQGNRLALFRRIAAACRALDAQLLLAHCGGLDAAQVEAVARAGATWVTDFAPQRAALKRADAVVSHGGLNTVLDALVAGTPMLALPIAFDHPGSAARLVRAGAGLSLSPRLATAGAIRRRLRRLLSDGSFRRHAARAGAEVAAAGGAPRAADLIEGTFNLRAAAPEARLAG
ncbi:glycosyltransferase [Azohydromonas aeria]|uniref:glycosyltransferase n=1 Tax=Azohydromonas aeria TaxID=2590212 RepID=UPI0012FA75AD|nr:glycosyltransferase [Azohydromonas aeria]